MEKDFDQKKILISHRKIKEGFDFNKFDFVYFNNHAVDGVDVI